MNDVLGEWEIHHSKVLSSLTYWQQHGGSILYATSSSSEDVEVEEEEQQLVMTALIFKTENVIKQLLVVHLIISVALHTHTRKQFI